MELNEEVDVPRGTLGQKTLNNYASDRCQNRGRVTIKGEMKDTFRAIINDKTIAESRIDDHLTSLFTVFLWCRGGDFIPINHEIDKVEPE